MKQLFPGFNLLPLHPLFFPSLPPSCLRVCSSAFSPTLELASLLLGLGIELRVLLLVLLPRKSLPFSHHWRKNWIFFESASSAQQRQWRWRWWKSGRGRRGERKELWRKTCIWASNDGLQAHLIIKNFCKQCRVKFAES